MSQRDDLSPDPAGKQDVRSPAWQLHENVSNWVINGLLVLFCVLVVVGGDGLLGEKGFTRRHVFWVLAVLPGLAAVVSFWIAETPRFRRRSADIDDWLETLAGDEQRDLRTKNFRDFVQRTQVDAETGRPRFAYTFFGALALTTVFGVAAELSTGPAGIGVPRTQASSEISAKGDTRKRSASLFVTPLSEPSSASPVAVTKEVASGSSPPAPPTETVREQSFRKLTASANLMPTADGRGTERGTGSGGEQKKTSQRADDTNREKEKGESPPPVDEGVRGLVYAAYGAYLYAISLFIGRLGSASLSGKFLVRLALRCSTSIVLGFVAGELQIFASIVKENQALFLYFALGLFPAWAIGALRRKAKEVFSPDEKGCELLPPCLVDGLDDDTSDRLSELGITDIQHLATADPIELTLRTLLPLNRVLDWIDQAMLISYVRGSIVTFRQTGIRGAIDLSVLYGDITNQMDKGEDLNKRIERANDVLDSISKKANMSTKTILMIARSLFEDENVSLIWDLWQGAPPATAHTAPE